MRPRGTGQRGALLGAIGVCAWTTATALGCGSSKGNSASTGPDASVAAQLDGGALSVPPGIGEDGGDGGCVHGPFPSPDIYDAHCNFDLAAYQHLAQSLGAEDGLRYRLGPDSTYYHTTPQSFPLLPRAAIRNCGYTSGPPPGVILYQLGDHCTPGNAGNYSAVQALVLYDVDPPFLDGGPTGANGVDTIGIDNYGYNTLYYFPAPTGDTSVPASSFLNSPAWEDAGGGPVRRPVAVARGIPAGGQTSQGGFIAFNDGVVGAIGPSTEPGGYATSVPAGLVPTALGLTNGNEFVLVTLWDVANVRAKLGVFAVDADFAGRNDLDATYYGFKQHLPGFVNVGTPTSMKFLGAIDLPGMIAPTDIAVASDFKESPFFDVGGGNFEQTSDFDLTQETQWASFTGTGPNAGVRSKSGFAMITSRSERKVIFVDLQPLFEAFNDEYFTDFSTFMMTQTNWGPAPTQWPFTFDVQPKATPVIVSTLTTGEIPTAVYAGRYGISDPTMAINGLVATMDGTLHIYKLGGLVDVTAAAASDIQEIGSMQVGNNPVYLGKKDSKQGVIIAARGDRTVNFATITGSTGTIVAQIQDSALIDPVYVDEADNQAFGANVLSVADLNGKQIVNYRNGTVTLPYDAGVYPLPTGPDGGPVIESGGSYSVRGTPFAVSGTNVP